MYMLWAILQVFCSFVWRSDSHEHLNTKLSYMDLDVIRNIAHKSFNWVMFFYGILHLFLSLKSGNVRKSLKG